MKDISPKMIHINLYYCKPGFYTNDRILRNPYFLYIHKGKGSFKIGNKVYDAHPGEIFFCPAGNSNAIRADEKDPFVLSGIDFECRSINGLFDDVLDLSGNIGHEDLMMEMIRSFANPDDISSKYCDALLKAFIFNIYVYKTFKIKSTGSDAAILKFLTENLGVADSVKLAGEVFNYHPSTINRIVKNATGMSAKEYQIAARIRKAKGLLLYSDKTISEIAEECKYSSVFFFSRQFKEKTGMLPSEMRKRN
ncbi:MAG: AraC family transcriptional regulator [Candidatus Dojkabacteria bacterium]